MADLAASWDEELASFATGYGVGEGAVRKRQERWDPCVSGVLLPTLERAAEILRRNGLENASATRYVFGTKIESVQLYTGLESGPPRFLTSGADGAPALVTEVGATLGYSIGVPGHVMRWFRRHWLTGFGDDHPPWTTLEVHEDAAALTAGLVERHVVAFLKAAWETSYRGATIGARDPIGFFRSQKER